MNRFVHAGLSSANVGAPVNSNANWGLCPGESASGIVVGAWDFARLNRRYARHLKAWRSARAACSAI